MDTQVNIYLESSTISPDTSLPTKSKIKRFLYRKKLSFPKPLRNENAQCMLIYGYLLL